MRSSLVLLESVNPERLGHQQLDQIGIGNAAMGRLFGHEAERGHARLGVHFEQKQTFYTLLVIPAEIAAAGALAAEQLVGAERYVLARFGDLVRDFRRANMVGHAVGILGVEIVET